MTYTARWTNFYQLNLESIRDFCQISSFPVKDRDPSFLISHSDNSFTPNFKTSIFGQFNFQRSVMKIRVHSWPYRSVFYLYFFKSMALEVINWAIWSFIVRKTVRVVYVRVAIVRFCFVMNSTLTPQSKQSSKNHIITQKCLKYV